MTRLADDTGIVATAGHDEGNVVGRDEMDRPSPLRPVAATAVAEPRPLD
jgi:hypothetical protein